MLQTDNKLHQLLPIHKNSSVSHLQTLCGVDAVPFLQERSSSCFYGVFA